MINRSNYILNLETYKLLNSFNKLFGIRIAFFDKFRNEIVVGSDKPICTFCRLLRQNLGRTELCRQSDTSLFNNADQKQRIIDHLCHAGLFEA